MLLLFSPEVVVWFWIIDNLQGLFLSNSVGLSVSGVHQGKLTMVQYWSACCPCLRASECSIMSFSMMQCRPSNPGWTMQSAQKFYCTVEDAVLSTANWQLAATDLDARLTTICEHFKEDLDRYRLQTNFAMLPEFMEGKTADSHWHYWTGLNTNLALGLAKRLHGELVKLVVLMFEMQATSATVDRGKLQCHIHRLKNFLRFTTGQELPNINVILLNILP
jgi:hypothetical protein